MLPLLSLLSIFFILFLLLLFIIILFWLTHTNQSPYYPTETYRLKLLIEKGELKIDNNTKFIDVGSGDGRVVDLISQYKPKFAHGIDINPFLTLASKLSFFIKRRKNTKIFNGNFFNHNFSGYNLVYAFIFTESLEKLLNKLNKEVDEGCILVSNTFRLSSISPFKIIDNFYFYKIK